MKVVNLAQRSPEWHEWRRHGVSASEAAVILGRSPHKTPWRLWAEKTGRLPEEDLSKNPNVRRGVRLEDIARQAVEQYKQEYGTMLLPVCVEHDNMPWLRASLDGLNERDEPVELKCPADSTFEKVKAEGRQSEAFQLYYPQVQFQMMVIGAQRGYLAFYSGASGGALETFTLDLDVSLVSELSTKARAFWKSIENGQPPPLDPARDIYVPAGDDRKAWEKRVERRNRLLEAAAKEEQALKAIKAKIKANENELVPLMGEFSHAAAAGLSVTRYAQQGSVDYPKLLADQLPDLDPVVLDRYRRKASFRVRLTNTDTEVIEKAAEAVVTEAPAKAQDQEEPTPSKPAVTETFPWGDGQFAW